MPLTDNFFGFYDLDTDSGDRSGHGNDGSDTSVSYNGTEATFGGSSVISTPITTALSDFTCSVWFKATSNAAYQRLVDKLYNGGFWLGRNGNANDEWGGGVEEGGSPFGIFGTATDGAQHHIVSVRSGTTHNLYIDGSLAASNTVSAAPTDSTALVIGDAVSGFAGHVGTIRCVGLSSDAKDQAWVTSVYNGGTPLKYADMTGGGGISGTFSNNNGSGTITVTGAAETVNVDNGRGTVTVTGSAGTFAADNGIGSFTIA